MKKVSILPLFFLGLMSHAQSSENEIIKVSNMRERVEYNVLAYPNPSHGDLHIEAPEGAICQIVSTKGIYIGSWEVKENGLDIKELPTGTYVTTISFGQKLTTKRILVL